MYRKNNRKIVNKTSQTRRFADLARLGEDIFHTKDLANLWCITNANTLYTTLKRYTQQGLIYRIYKGLYSLKPNQELDPQKLGLKALRSYAYVSTETVLSENGIIQQSLPYITLVSSKSKKFSIAGWDYRSRRLNDKYLLNQIGVIEMGGVKKATVSRAVADLLYFNPKTFFDNPKAVNWAEVKKIQNEIGYWLVTRN